MKEPKPKYKQAPLVERISIHLDDEKKQKLNHWIDSQKYRIEQDRGAWFERQQKYLVNYDEFVQNVRKGPWDGSSNIRLPFTAIMVKSYHARLYNMFNQPDVISLIGRENTDDEIAAVYKKLYSWYIWDYLNEFRGISGVIDELYMDVATVGWGVVMKDWFIKQRKTLDIIKNEVDSEEVQKETELMNEEIEDTGKASVSAYKEVAKIITVFEGTRIRTVPYENIYFQNYIPESNDLNYPPIVIIDTKMTESVLNLKVKQGVFDKESVDKIIAAGTSVGQKDTQAQRANENRSRSSGYDESNYGSELHEYDMQYALCTYDIDDDGIDEEIVVMRSAKGEIAEVNYLDRLTLSGKRPVYKFDCFPKARQAYARGIPEYCYSLQSEMDMNHNMRQDYMQLQTCPFGTYRSTSNLKNEPIRIAPGKFIPVDENNDLRVVTFNSNAAIWQSEENILWNYGQQLVNVSPMSHGMVPQSVGPTRSTSGVVTLLEQMEKEFRPIIDRNAKVWKQLHTAILEDLDYKLPLAVKMRCLGAGASETINLLLKKTMARTEYDALRINARMDLQVEVANLANSEEMRRNNAFQIFQMSSAPSLLQQTGVVTPRNMYNAYSKWLKTFSFINPDDFATAPQDTGPALTLAQEIQFVFQGLVPPLNLQDDHNAKANGLMAYGQSPEYAEAKRLGSTVGSTDDILSATISKHQSMAQSLQPQGLPNPTGANGADMNAMITGTAPQQGGNSGRTTNRPEQENAPASNGEGPQEAVQQ